MTRLSLLITFSFATAAAIAGCSIDDIVIEPTDPSDPANPGNPSDPGNPGNPGSPDAGVPEPPPLDPAPNFDLFDQVVFFEVVEPALFDSGCATTNCHSASGGVSFGLLTLHPNTQFGSAEMLANMNSVITLINLDNPPEFNYFAHFARDAHRGFTLTPDAFQNTVDWMTDAFFRQPIPELDPTIEASYVDTVQPLLDQAGCLNSGCHGAAFNGGLPDPTPFKLIPDGDRTDEDNQINFRVVVSSIQNQLGVNDARDLSLFIRSTDGHTGFEIADPDLLEGWLNEVLAGLAE